MHAAAMTCLSAADRVEKTKRRMDQRASGTVTELVPFERKPRCHYKHVVGEAGGMRGVGRLSLRLKLCKLGSEVDFFLDKRIVFIGHLVPLLVFKLLDFLNLHFK